MGESIYGLKRTHMCAQLNKDNIGQDVVLMGWVQRKRNLGGMVFVTLRDRTGIIQVIFDDKTEKSIFEKVESVKSEYVLAVIGKVFARTPKDVNKNMKTGEIEIQASDLRILSEAETPPIYIEEDIDANELVRLKYRYLDLRRPDMQRNLMLRHKVAKVARDYYDENGFLTGINIVDKDNSLSCDEMIEKAQVELTNLIKKGYSGVLENNKQFFNNVYENSDIEIAGDDKNQQGIRYCIFQLAQTYHGYAKDNNIGAKGLTGEAYSGHSFWDSETYCLPYYLFSNEEASKNLLMFRYNTLEEAKKRAIDLDCEGACYPIATRNGKEGCNLWQHASLQFQPSTGVVYAIYHYMNLYNDHEFFQNYGLEMVVEVCKFLLSRGDYNQDHTKFSFYNVMGPDEFQMMVNHNVYTNYMAKKTFDYLLKIINDKEYDVNKVLNKCGFTNNHLEKMIDASEKMVILYDDETKLFEQNAGFFDLPHIEVDKIPTSDFPLYSHWSYDRIYRNDMIKQPDVLMFMFLFNQDFTLEQKKANYEYYEPRCIHESSLSPSIHSIFASEIGKIDEAYKFFEFATRLDLDDYNCNTCEGIHTTSIAAAWMNIVYGFGGLRSDREELVLNPVIVDKWDYYSFKIKYHGSVIKVKVGKKQLCIKVSSPVKLKIYGDDYTIKEELTLELN